MKSLPKFFLIAALLGLSHFLQAEDAFGYVSYHTTNIGDDIQSIAARQFIPEADHPINRDFIANYENDETVHASLNGWYMHVSDVYWCRPDLDPPQKQWPPGPCIDPLLISIYIWPHFEPAAFSEEGIAYFKKYGPVGARDLTTLKKLKAHRIPSYFSGCLTLTLDNPHKGKRDDVIYAVDVSENCLEYLRHHTSSPVIQITHSITGKLFWDNDPEKRMEYAETLLSLYGRAKCVVTERLHAAMPCLALKTPVLLLCSPDNDRMDGLRELTWNCTESELLQGKMDYDFDSPPQNSDDYLELREALIKQVNTWANERQKPGKITAR